MFIVLLVINAHHVVTSVHHVTLPPLWLVLPLPLHCLIGCNFIGGRRLMVARFQQNFNTKVCSFFSQTCVIFVHFFSCILKIMN
jgi:hypothetical protein